MKLYAFSPYILQSIIWIPCRILFSFFTRLKISGIENIKDLDRGMIFASNHLSELDPILIPSSLPIFSQFTPMFYVSRERSFYENSGWRQIIYGGLFFKAWGAYPSVSGKKNYELALQNHIEIVRQGNNLSIFPEGRRNYDGVIRRARGGVAYLSYKTNRPIVPVRIRNTHMTVKDFITRKNAVEIVFGKLVYPQDLFVAEPVVNEERNDFVEAAEKVMDMVRKL